MDRHTRERPKTPIHPLLLQIRSIRPIELRTASILGVGLRLILSLSSHKLRQLVPPSSSPFLSISFLLIHLGGNLLEKKPSFVWIGNFFFFFSRALFRRNMHEIAGMFFFFFRNLINIKRRELNVYIGNFRYVSDPVFFLLVVYFF